MRKLRLLRLRFDLFRLLAKLNHFRGDTAGGTIAEILVAVLVDAAAGVAAGGALLGVGEPDVRVYCVDHRLLVGGEGGAGLHVPAGDAVVNPPADPRTAGRGSRALGP